jgi:cytochrome c5
MRHIRDTAAFWLIATILVLSTVLFAAVRSQVPGGPTPVVAQQGAPDSEQRGASVYTKHCSSCHREGEARGRAIPPLRGFAVELLLSDGGRDYLVDFLLDGRVRLVENGATTFVPSHPEYATLSDDEVAAVLNHMLTSWGNAELLPEDVPPYSAVEVASRRPTADR